MDTLIDKGGKFANMDPDREGDVLQMTVIIIGQLAPAITRMLQTLEAEDSRKINKIVRNCKEII